jgi:ubiquinone/menaquinone biosynthesis C-methylase UbiE
MHRSKASNKDIMNFVIANLEKELRRPTNNTGPLKVLDVAAGTMIFARSIMSHMKEIQEPCEMVALDATDAMLKQGVGAAEAEGIDSIVTMLGDAAALPFPDNHFDLVVSRLAVHHFSYPEGQRGIMKEMARVAKVGGHVVVVDLAAPNDEGEAAEMNRLENLRDPTHTTALSCQGICSLLQESGGLVVVNSSQGGQVLPQIVNLMDLEAWMSATGTADAAQAVIREAVQADLEQGTGKSGMGPLSRDDEGRIYFTHHYTVASGRKV